MSEPTSLKRLLGEHGVEAAGELVVQGENGTVRCLACGHRCRVAPGKAGVCRVRVNEGGRLMTPGGYVCGLQVDPIEKKPFFHAYPGREALSFGMLGCNFHCPFCQNWISSQVLRDDQAIATPQPTTAARLVELAVENNAPVMVSTYNEPLITAEWSVEIFKLARAEGIVCGMVSNGNGTPEVLEFIRPYVDLYKVDLKCFDDQRYRKLGGVLENVLDTIRRAVSMGFWVEVVTLVVPGFNDSDAELGRIARFLGGVSPDIPWHVTAFHPDYQMTDRGRTPAERLARARELGREAGLRFVYAGNLPARLDHAEDTACPGCGQTLIRRSGFRVEDNRMSGDTCGGCGQTIPGIWEAAPPRAGQAAGMPRPV